MNKPLTDLKADAEVAPSPLARLREPFADNHISKLPKETKAQKEERERDRSKGISCQVCGGWHHRSTIHLDYVGHAALTDRLLDVDPDWTWEPMGTTPEGLPAFDHVGGLWIKLTVCGLTRPGYGAADGKKGGDAVKEIIGDALRNAAMRFGAALDLWHKGDLHAEPEAPPPLSVEEQAINLLRSLSSSKEHFRDAWEKNKPGWKNMLDGAAYARVVGVMKEIGEAFPKEPPPADPPSPEPEPQRFQLDDEIPF